MLAAVPAVCSAATPPANTTSPATVCLHCITIPFHLSAQGLPQPSRDHQQLRKGVPQLISHAFGPCAGPCCSGSALHHEAVRDKPGSCRSFTSTPRPRAIVESRRAVLQAVAAHRPCHSSYHGHGSGRSVPPPPQSCSCARCPLRKQTSSPTAPCQARLWVGVGWATAQGPQISGASYY
jgi:hypothetical protein